MITLLVLSFMAGALTIAAPCILPLLPVFIGSALTIDGTVRKPPWYRPLVVAASLAGSIVLFTLLLKATTLLLGVPQAVWAAISGMIILLFGAHMLWPQLWERIAIALRLPINANNILYRSTHRQGLLRDILVGASLGPVFNSCSPTYALIVATILPVSFGQGLLYLSAYALGLVAVLLLIAVAGQALTSKLGWLSNSHSWFNRTLGVVFILVAIAIISGWDRLLQSYVLQQGWYDPIMMLEQRIMR